MHRRHGRHRSRSTRFRRYDETDGWQVEARIARFVEPALLLELSAGPSHGYELADRLSASTGVEVDYGNLYRLLRVQEQEAIVSSVWDDDAPGRSKRVYALTEHGAALLDAWAVALRSTGERISRFLDEYDERT